MLIALTVVPSKSPSTTPINLDHDGFAPGVSPEIVGSLCNSQRCNHGRTEQREREQRNCQPALRRSVIRAVSNLIVTLNRLGEFDEAMDFTRVLEDRCGDRRTAVHYRAKILLNVGAYTDALSCAEEFHEGNSQESFIASLAAFELGRTEIAIAHFLYAALRYPQASRMIAGYKGRKPRTREEYGDHVLGLELVSNLV